MAYLLVLSAAIPFADLYYQRTSHTWRQVRRSLVPSEGDMGKLTDPMKSLFVELSAKVSILLISAAMLLMKLLTNGSSVSGAKTR